MVKDFFDDVALEEVKYDNIRRLAHWHMDSSVDIDDTDTPGGSLEPGHLRAASQLLEHAVQGYHNSEKLKQMAEAQPPPIPPTEPLDKQKKLHEYALMRFTALYESEDRPALQIVDDMDYECLGSMFSEEDINPKKDLDMVNGRDHSVTYEELIPSYSMLKPESGETSKHEHK